MENVSERIRLYRELDNIANEEALQRFEIEMKDRFGENSGSGCRVDGGGPDSSEMYRLGNRAVDGEE